MQKLVNELRDELRQELKTAREAIERDFRAQIKALRAEFRDDAHSMEHMNAVFEDTRQNYDAIKTENAELKEENSNLRTELDEIKKRLADAESRLQHSEQYSRNKNIEIKGIEENPNEDVTAVVCKLGQLSGVNVVPDDIEACHRVHARNKPGCIIVQFTRRQKRDDLLEKARKLRLKNSDFGNNSASPVYVNDHLCPTLKRLLGMAVTKKRESGWKYVWCRNGKIFAKKSDGSETLAIRREHDLEKIQ